jgi:hypothetical protein
VCLWGLPMIWSGAQPAGELATGAPVPVAAQARELRGGSDQGDRAPRRPGRIGRTLVRGASMALFLLGVSAASAAAVWQYAAPRLELVSPSSLGRTVRATHGSSPQGPVVNAAKERAEQTAQRRVHNANLWSASAAATAAARRGQKGSVGAARATERSSGGRPNLAAGYGWALAETLAGPARACAAGGDWIRRSPDGRTIYLCGGGRFRVQHDGRVLASCTAQGCDKTTLYHLVRSQ